MSRGHPLKELEVSQGAREELVSLVRSRSLPAGLVRRAEIVLLCAGGLDNKAVAEEGPHQPPNGRQVAPTLPNPGPSWACTTNAGRESRGPSKMTKSWCCCRGRSRPSLPTAARTGVAVPWQTRRGCRSPRSIASGERSTSSLTGRSTSSSPPIRSSPGRSAISSDSTLNPPDNAMVLCVDEKSQTQALERTQPLLPLGLGYVEGVTHGYIRHGTTTVFAALDVATGQVIAQCKPRHRHQEFLSFLRHIDASVPPATLPYPFHSHLLLLAQPGRDLVQHHHPEGHPPRLLLLGHPTQGEDPPLHRQLQPRRASLLVDRHLRLHSTEDPETMYIYLWDTTLAVRGQNPPGIRAPMHPRWTASLSSSQCNDNITLCHV